MRCWKAVIPVTAADNTERLHELYEGFNDIRAELEDAVISFELLQEDMTVKNVRKSIENFISDDKLRLIASSRLAEATDLMRTDGDSISKIVRFLV